MFSERTQFALDHLLKKDLFQMHSDHYDLREDDPKGQSILHIGGIGENLCIENLDKKVGFNFLNEDPINGMGKQSDHLIFEHINSKWILHIIEMKTTVNDKEWVSIRYKSRTSYLMALSIAVFLGIEITQIHAYTTYEKEKFRSIDQPTKPLIYKARLGERKPDNKKDEWDAGRLVFQIADNIVLPHTPVKMIRNEKGVLEGSLDISMSRHI